MTYFSQNKPYVSSDAWGGGITEKSNQKFKGTKKPFKLGLFHYNQIISFLNKDIKFNPFVIPQDMFDFILNIVFMRERRRRKRQAGKNVNNLQQIQKAKQHSLKIGFY